VTSEPSEPSEARETTAGPAVPTTAPDGADPRVTSDAPATPGESGRDRRAARAAGASWPALVVFLAALGVGAGVRAWQIGGRAPLPWNDTADFLTISRQGWASVGLWAGARAPGVPVALKLAGTGDRYVDLQAAGAAVCWAALCASVATVVAGRAARVAAVSVVLAFSLTTPLTMWDRSILSESPGIAALALVVAAGLQVARGLTWGRVAMLGSALVPWLAVRDTHAVVALVGGAAALAGALVVAVLSRRHQRRAEDTAPAPQRRPLRVAVVGALSVGLGLLVLAGAAHGERQAFPTRNVYEVRVLPYPERVRWFADHGMPQADEFLGPDARHPYREPGQAPVVFVPDGDPELGEWLAWVEGDGRAALVRFALTHPAYLVREPLRTPERTFNNARGDRSFYEPSDHPHVPLVDALLAHRTFTVLLVGGVAGAWAIARRRATPALVVGAVTAALALPHGAVAWHSDGMETARHLVVPAIQLHLGVLLMVLGVLPAATATTEPLPADGVASTHV
jgi:hypothetical protein